MRSSSFAATCLVIAAGLSSSACNSTTQAREAKRSTSTEISDQVEVVPLQFAVADETARVLRNSLGSRGLRIESDVRTNSLILAGPTSDVAAAKALIAKLDVQVH